ncbi:MAG: imidazolonepropionase [Bacillota bacterium]|nr:imidazolonepropionase [Bacillota bacterium]
MKDKKADLIIANAAELLTCSGKDGGFEIIENGWLAVSGDRIISIGSEKEAAPLIDNEKTEIIDARGKVVLPGFIDCHTHLVFAGSRIEEYTAKLIGTDLSILAEKGIKTGILVTVGQTRDASAEYLLETALERLGRMLESGTTTVESKSGYGLCTAAELKILRVNKALRNNSPVDVCTTFLGAHGWPDDMAREYYMEIISKEMIPAVTEEKLADFCDVWCDEGYYSAKESEQILKKGLDYGLRSKIHTDAYSYIGGSDLAAEMKMISADHLNFTPVEAMKKLAKAGVTGVLLPALDFVVRHPRPFDYLEMKRQGMTVALATNLCPGCWVESMQFVILLACRLYGMTPLEAIAAATLGGAMALGIEGDTGSLEKDKFADIQIWDAPRHEYVVYRAGGNLVEKVYKKGRLVVNRSV